jgi:hypothetical protein
VPPEDVATPSPEPTHIPKARVYTGSGDDVVRIKLPDDLDVLTATYTGYSNFIVDARGKHGLDNNLINVIGHYHGTTALNFDDSHPEVLQVQATGPWKFKVASLLTVPQFNHKTHGFGDSVVAYEGHSSIFHITSTGRENIIVDEYSDSGQSNLVNEIGYYHGTVFGDDGPAFIVFQATGRWTISAK